MSDPVHYEKRGPVAVITLDSPPVNALGADMRRGIAQCLEEGAADPAVTALVVTGAGRCFSGGADIREFGEAPAEPILPALILKVEDCAKPVVAAIHGTALGGGLELALGCHYRIGAPSARVGLPEVKLGIIPGAGGTQRLPRLIGAEAALRMIVSGDPVDAEEARTLGILDAIAEDDLVAAAVAFATAKADQAGPPPRTRERPVAGATADLFEAERGRIKRRARDLIAPGLAIDSVENAATLPFAEGIAKEREYFVRCRESEQSKAQRHIFFAEREAAKVPDVPRDTARQPIDSAAVIGCGTMGVGIAMSLANAGIPVWVMEASPEALEKGLGAIRRTYAAAVAKGRLAESGMAARLGLITGVRDYAKIAGVDIVIEAVFEDMDLKKEVFRALDAACKAETILATNTSTLDVDEIAAATARPDRVIGTHFFSPAHVMRLMENVRGAKTSKETIATVMGLSKMMGKVGVLVGICDGFVGNRMYHAYTRQANFLLEEGALPEQVDRVITDFGFPMGPFAVGDLAGLDVGWRIRQRRAKTRPKDERYSPIADRICERGRFGQKTGAGWYRYEAGSRTPIPDPEVEALIVGVSEELGFTRRAIDDQEILERCVYTLINEGAQILDEGLALRSGDIDVIWIHGYGFPVYRGGPMFYADTVGATTVAEALTRLTEAHGPLLAPAPLLKRLAADGRAFEDL